MDCRPAPAGSARLPGRGMGPSFYRLAAALLLSPATVHAAAPDDSPSRFRTAPAEVADQKVLARVSVNGVDQGIHEIRVSGDKVSVPRASLSELRLGNLASDALELVPGGAVAYRWDAPKSELSMTVGASSLQSLRIGADGDSGQQLVLSPEAWGGWANYDLNVRRSFGGTPAGARTLGAGGIVGFHGTGPDVAANSTWSYDSQRTTGTTVRLDSNATWRPSDRPWSVTAGDSVSEVTGGARPLRYGGIEIGTDHSAQPGFNTNPLAQVSGTAAAESNIDVYVDSQRISRVPTAGGAFTLALPNGTAANRVVVTDVTGKQTVISIVAPRVDAQIIAKGLFLWSGGAGAPRFNYGSFSDTYGPGIYGHANARYGLTDKVTLTGHSEGGAGVAEAEVGGNWAATPWLAVRADVGGSRSRRGTGGYGSLAAVVSGPYGLSLDASVSRATRKFDDVVSVTGLARAKRTNTPLYLSLPAGGNESARLSWAATRDLSFQASFDRFSYPGTGSTGFASAGVQDNFRGVPVFANVSTNVGGRRNTTFLVGFSLSFGAVNASASGGYGTQGPSGSIGAARPLEESVGSVGWRAIGSRSGGQTFGTAQAETRTGFGIPGVEVDRFGPSTTAYATARGSVGFVGGHFFAGDPVQGGLIVADAASPGVPMTINGYPKGRTSFDGMAMVPVPVAGTPQTVGVAASDLPLDMVADETERTAVVRDGGATILRFGVRTNASGASVSVRDRGGAPPAGSTLVGAGASAPVDGRGRAYLPSILPGETLSLRRADGSSCSVSTGFDGKGGPGRRIGPFDCRETVK